MFTNPSSAWPGVARAHRVEITRSVLFIVSPFWDREARICSADCLIQVDYARLLRPKGTQSRADENRDLERQLSQGPNGARARLARPRSARRAPDAGDEA